MAKANNSAATIDENEMSAQDCEIKQSEWAYQCRQHFRETYIRHMWHPEKTVVIISSLASYTGLKWDIQIKQIVLWETPSGIQCDHTCTSDYLSCPMGLSSPFHCYSQSRWTSFECNASRNISAHGWSCKNNAVKWLRCRQLVVCVSSLPKTEVTETNKYSIPLPPPNIWHFNSVTQQSTVGIRATIFDKCMAIYDPALCGQSWGQPWNEVPFEEFWRQIWLRAGSAQHTTLKLCPLHPEGGWASPASKTSFADHREDHRNLTAPFIHIGLGLHRNWWEMDHHVSLESRWRVCLVGQSEYHL